ncbi:hypothetical protein IF1G_11345 [Cordyceps javanica]|uniref:Uncharacterized protein n=1 Tax=Cordyceps javanica TaxID=43265 RepID=A0A545UKJ9_9HYPO|nr:hypothetical protein IF1G_11345 [Cordyceps javanica]TQW01423.1 hypothetical protein IF2G_11057 [Cordyceps javanica]
MEWLPDFLVQLERVANNDGGRHDDDPIKFFTWRGQKIAYFQDMVNVSQMLLAAKHHPNALNRLGLQKLLHDAKTTMSGAFISYAKAIRVCTKLYIKFNDLPDFITGRSDPQVPDDCFDFFKWHGRSVAYIPHRRLVNAGHMFTAVGYTRQTIHMESFGKHFSEKYFHKGSRKFEGTYILYGDAIRVCEDKAIDISQLPAWFEV